MTTTIAVEDASQKWPDTQPELSVAEVQELPDVLKQRIIAYHLVCARLHLLGPHNDYKRAQQELIRVTNFDVESADGWSLLGQISYMTDDHHAAKEYFERCMLLTTWPPTDEHLLYLRLGSIYLHDEQFQKAKELFLLACKSSPTALTWFGVGVACYRLDELDSAEEALTEANYLNNRDATIWAYLSLICLKTRRQVEAEQAYKYAIKMRLQDQTLLDEIHSLQTEMGFGNPLAFQNGLINCTL